MKNLFYKLSAKTLITLPLAMLVLVSFELSTQKAKTDMNSNEKLNTYVIEREIPNAGDMNSDELKAASKASNAVIDELKPGIEWKQSYVVDDKLYCVFKAQDTSLIMEHARRADVPANSIRPVSAIIDPSTANGSD